MLIATCKKHVPCIVFYQQLTNKYLIAGIQPNNHNDVQVRVMNEFWVHAGDLGYHLNGFHSMMKKYLKVTNLVQYKERSLQSGIIAYTIPK